jgi:tight adherence protein B
MNTSMTLITISVLTFAAVFGAMSFGYPYLRAGLADIEQWFTRVLVHQLLIDISPRIAMVMSAIAIVTLGFIASQLAGHPAWFFIGAAVGALAPYAVVRALQEKRRERLERQLVDGITTLSSGVRAGLNLVQSIEMLVNNALAPIRQEFAQLLREYQMGVNLNHAMRHTADRIGSSHYRLLFTALEMHRRRGGNTADSLDRICDAVREIQRLEGQLDAVTAGSRYQAYSIALMPVVLLAILYMVNPEGVSFLFVDPVGRILLLATAALIVGAYVWIRKIMNVDI